MKIGRDYWNCIQSSRYLSQIPILLDTLHPRSKRWHKVDLIITRQHDLREIHHTRTHQSADCDTDHSLALKKKYCTKQPGHMRINVAKAQGPVSATAFNKDMQHVGIASSLKNAATMWGRMKRGKFLLP